MLTHAPGLVIVDNDDDWQPVAHRRVELGEVQADGAVTGQDENPSLRVGELGRQPKGQTRAKAAEIAVTEIASRPQRGERQLSPNERFASIDHEDAFLCHVSSNIVSKPVWMDR